jgi:hypothetical protein
MVVRRRAAVIHVETLLSPKYPERVCWGCNKHCRADALDCGNGTVRAQHPIEIFGEDWFEFSSVKSADSECGAHVPATDKGAIAGR